MPPLLPRGAVEGACVLLLSSWIATPALSQSFVEDFSTTTHRDDEATTAWWDTATGKLRLHPRTITLVGSLDTPDAALDVAVDGDFAYVADRTGGLRVVDIRDPSAPLAHGSAVPAGSAWGLVVDGDWGFVTIGNTVQSVSLANPAAPAFIGLYTSSATTHGLALAGDRLYVANGTAGLLVLDVSNPSSLAWVGSYNTPGSVIDVAVAGDLAFVADRGAGLRILSILNPAPAFLGSWDTPGDAWGIAVDGDFAYVGDAGPGVHVVDVSNPVSPSLLGTCNTPSSARGLVATGDFVYVADYGFVHAIDVSDPSDPAIVDTYDTPGIASNVALAGEHVLVADGAAGGLQILAGCDLLEPWAPTVAVSDYSAAHFAAPFGDHMFVGRPTEGLEVWDIADPRAPVLVASAPTLVPRDLALAGDYAYGVGEDGLEVIRIGNPRAPTKAAGHTRPIDPRAVAVDGNFVYVLDAENIPATFDFSVYDISTPTLPLFVGGRNLPSSDPRDVAVAGTYAYVAAGTAGLQVVHVGDPSNPYVVASRPAGNARGVAVSGNHVLVAGGSLWIYDVTAPTDPVLVTERLVQPSAVSVAVSGDLAFVGTCCLNSGGVEIFDFSNLPAWPTWRSSAGGWGSFGDLRLAGDFLFVGNSSGNFDSGWSIHAVFERILDTRNDVGQSGTFVVTPRDVHMARIGQSGSSIPESCWLSADDGLNWTVVLQHQFTPLFHPGRRLRWRCDLDYDHYATPPDLDALTIEWSYATDVELPSGTPERHALLPVAPNPFGGEAAIRFALPRAEPVTLRVHDVAGRRVATLARETLGPGVLEIRWDGRDDDGREVASGAYFVRLQAGDWQATRKVVRRD